MDPKIDFESFAEHASSTPGIDVRRLRPGTDLIIETYNSMYQLRVVDPPDQRVDIMGGIRIPQMVPAYIVGATYGGSMLRPGWIMPYMCLELKLPNRIVVTTPVKNVKMFGDGWDYDMGWHDMTT